MSEAVPSSDRPSSKDVASGFSSGVMAVPLPRALGRLILLRQLARGGMGDVYLAATTGIEGAERPCVVKTVRRDHMHDGSFLARFLDEARVQSQLHHPGVAQILEASTDENGEPYSVVEYVEGRSLADVRQRAVQMGVPIGWPEAVALTIEMGQALSHVHERAASDGTPLGIVHRDLSPQNVMVGFAGEVKLIDFGTARGHNRRCHTVAGVVFAKPGYVAPEVARQQVGDGRIDVYAMGVMLWELCSGKRLLSGDPQKYLEQVAADAAEVPALAPTRRIPAELDRVIAKLVANDPDDRYVSASVAATDLAKVLALAPATAAGQRSVRARIAVLMKQLWPNEPARSRAEFAKLLKEARVLKLDAETPPVSTVMEAAASSMKLDSELLPGTPYRLVRKIGEGASGEVYEAEHVELGRRLAVKLLSTAHSAAQGTVERFRREARAIAKLSHPNIVGLHDFGKSLDGRVFLAMELLEGETVADRSEREVSWEEAVSIAVDTTLALDAAHAAGLVHRDINPQNLFISRGTVRLLDFGVATAMAGCEENLEDSRHKGFAIFGTPEYMAPEQVSGGDVDGRCDIYALGCVLYELLAGVPPFEGSAVVVMGKHLREQPPSIASVRPGRSIPPELEAVVMRALSKDRADRYADAAGLREALLAATAAPLRRRKAGALTAVAAGALCLAVVAGAWGLSMRSRATVASASATIPEVSVESLPRAASDEPLAEQSAPVPPPTGVPSGEGDEPPAGPRPEAATAERAAPDRDAPRHGAEVEPRPSALTVVALAGTEGPRSELVQARAEARARADDPQALSAWAHAALRAGALREARRAAEAWTREDDGFEPRLFLARVHEARGRRNEARAVLDAWLDTHPTSPEARRARSRIDQGAERGGTRL